MPRYRLRVEIQNIDEDEPPYMMSEEEEYDFSNPVHVFQIGARARWLAGSLAEVVHADRKREQDA